MTVECLTSALAVISSKAHAGFPVATGAVFLQPSDRRVFPAVSSHYYACRRRMSEISTPLALFSHCVMPCILGSKFCLAASLSYMDIGA